ncbi:hypothetical protein [uncultured Massilia sp.]|uniref:hypothetical protein n=1 Tax=uncultured Massilia sp. TaxID=169973 RepID=UPI002585124C|nr:hypothetical protein [uncultured Massilia sp.]
MDARTTAWLAKLRAEAEVPGTILVCAGRLRLRPDEIVGKSDDELLAHVRGLLEPR